MTRGKAIRVLVAGFVLAAAAWLGVDPATAGQPTPAGLEGISADVPEKDRQTLLTNPLLLELYRRDPSMGAAILKQLDDVRRRTRAPRRQRRDLEPEEKKILELNPAIDAAYRESPEAALDLIRLIREAVSK